MMAKKESDARLERTKTNFQGNCGPQVLAGLTATFGGFGTGCVLGWTSPALPLIRRDKAAAGQWGASIEERLSWVSGASSLGGVLGLLLTAPLLDRVGRKTTMLATAPVAVGGWLLLALARSDPGCVVGRLVTGAGAGAMCVAAPLYANEVVQSRLRGAVGASHQVLVASGILYAYLLALLDDYTLMTLLMTAPPALFAAAIAFVPESPYFLLARGRDEAAGVALQRLRWKGNDVSQELESIREEVLSALSRRRSLRYLPASRGTLFAVALALLLMAAQQLCGIGAVNFYAQFIFEKAVPAVDPKIQAIVLGIVQATDPFAPWKVSASAAAAVTMDAVGRRPLLLASCCVLAACLAALGAFFHLEARGGGAGGWWWVPLATLCVYVVAFSVGAGPIPWAMQGELLPVEHRAFAGCLCGAFNWALSFVVTKSFTSLVAAVTMAGAMWLYAALAALSAAAVALFLVETNRKSFAQVRAVLDGSPEPLHPRSPAASNYHTMH